MLIRIHPSVPVVWRNHTEVQIGVDPVRLVLTIDSRERAHALSAMIRGDTTDTIAGLWGRTEFDGILHALGSAIHPPAPPPAQTVVVDGPALSSETIATTLRAAGHHVSHAAHTDQDFGGRPDLAVLTSSFTVSPLDYQRWMAADVPHLPVVFGERTITVGPIIVPGVTACVSCIERHRADADQAWTAIGPQIWGRNSTLDSARAGVHVGGEILRLMGTRWGATVDIDGPTLRRTDGYVERHPLCVCAELPVTTTPGSGWESGEPTEAPAAAPNSSSTSDPLG